MLLPSGVNARAQGSFLWSFGLRWRRSRFEWGAGAVFPRLSDEARPSQTVGNHAGPKCRQSFQLNPQALSLETLDRVRVLPEG